MDNHPIPQDITGFQFKLIGNLTIRQFVYVAVGGILAWFFFFVLHLPFLLKWPLSIISFGAGAMVAFVPIDGRPMDQMIGNFVRAMMSPTQFIYQKSGGKLPDAQPTTTQVASQPLTAPAASNTIPQVAMPAQPQAPAVPQPIPVSSPQIPNAQMTPPAIVNLPTPAAQPTIQLGFQDPTSTPHGVIEELNEPEDKKEIEKEKEKSEAENLALQGQVVELKKELEATLAKAAAPIEAAPAQPTQPQPTQTQSELERQLEESRRQREALEKELLALKAKAETNAKPTFNPVIAKPLESTQRVRRVPFGMEKAVGIPSLPEAPNLITGIVKDPRGNPLPNILVEVKDQDANPVRAFKTNGLGKFASATSLSNGKYLIAFEDPKEQHKFDAVELEMQGAPVMPLEIISVDPREELRRELFA